jgi:hypothetical protein
MSWMDSWSRPSKHATTPPPLYLLPGGEATRYCHSCGRVIGSRKVQTSKSSSEVVKYCSERCRHQKPNVIDRTIEKMFVALLNGEDPTVSSSKELPEAVSHWKEGNASASMRKLKGDPRILVFCTTVEELVFGRRHDPEKVFGRKKNRAKRGVHETGEWKSVDMEDSTPQACEESSMNRSHDEENLGDLILGNGQEDQVPFGAGKVQPAQNSSDVNFSVGGERGWAEKIEETEELKQRRLQGQRKAAERESVRCAARRLCAFGVAVVGEAGKGNEENSPAIRKQKKNASASLAHDPPEQIEKRKMCEAVLREGTVVEASFAKGEWGIRWRE